jgi:hypothetical protein
VNTTFGSATLDGQMRVYDTQQAIYEGLRGLPWFPYLGAMHTLCEVLQAQYQDRLADSERTLMKRDPAHRQGNRAVRRPAGDAGPARELAAKWAALIDDDRSSVLPGHWNTWCTFEAVAAEIAGTAGRHSATERLLLAATERWREPYPSKARRIDRDEEAPDSSGLAQTLAAFERVVSTASQDPPR